LRTVLVVPARDEAGKISRVAAGFGKAGVDEVIIVDDGSTDSTAAEAAAEGATVLRHETRRGVGAAIRTGIDYALRTPFDVLVVAGGDDQDDPAQLEALLAPIRQGRADLVQGSRWAPGGSTIDMPLSRRILTRAYSWLFSMLSGHSMSDATNGYRALRRELLQDPRIHLHQPWLDGYELEPYLLWRAQRGGLRVTEVGVTKRYHRQEGFTKMRPLVDWWRILRPLFLLKLRLRS
jgi:dolichol-phosphate mannosyltransferase